MDERDADATNPAAAAADDEIQQWVPILIAAFDPTIDEERKVAKRMYRLGRWAAAIMVWYVSVSAGILCSASFS